MIVKLRDHMLVSIVGGEKQVENEAKKEKKNNLLENWNVFKLIVISIVGVTEGVYFFRTRGGAKNKAD